MLKVDIYVNGTRLDLFKDENIRMVDTLQNSRDPASIFTSFSQTFTVPASKTNNKIFKHYYNSRLQPTLSGYDARFPLDTTITINGSDYKYGKLKLNSIKLKNNKAYSYTVNFVGDGARLTSLTSEADLSTLRSLGDYDHDYSLANVKSGVEDGLGLNTSGVMEATGATDSTELSIIYPLISHTKRYVYDASNTAASTFKLYNPAVTAGTEGLEYNQLKPAIKLIHIIEAIEAEYSDEGLVFSRDFFGDSVFDDLYMWLNRTKGFIAGLEENVSSVEAWDWVWDTISTDVVERSTYTGTEGLLYVVPYDYTGTSGSGPLRTFEATYDVTITGTGLYSFKVYDTGLTNDLIFSSDSNTGSQAFVVPLEAKGAVGDTGYYVSSWSPRVEIESAGTITAIDVELSMERSTYSPGANYTPTVETGVYDIPLITPNNYLSVSAVIPKMTIMDFLRGIFKMFNLTHYTKSDGTIYVDTLDNFYALGSDIDITELVDASDSDVSVPIPYDYISFQHTEPKTFLTKNRFEILNDVFGNEQYSLGELFGGSKYEINTGFSHMLFEDLEDLNDGTYPEILFGWAVDEDENPTVDAPLIVYHRGQVTVVNNIDFDDESEISTYQSIGNTDSTAPDGNSLHFGVELDEVSLGSNDKSLYATYWENYISEVYGSSARLVRYSAYLTPSFMLNYNLYDKIIVNGVRHKINSITIDLIDGKAELELITE